MANNTHSLDLELSSSQYSQITDASQTGLDFTTAITLEAWIKAESLASDGVIMSKYLAAGNQRSYRFQVNTTGTLSLLVSSDGTSGTSGSFQRYDTNSSVVSTGTWVHVAVSFDLSSETCVFYNNTSTAANTKVTGTTIGASLHNSTAAFQVGTSDGGNFYDGLINNARAWSVIRSQAQLAAAYQSVLETGTGLQGSWYANNNHNDLGPNGNNLSAVNSPVFSTDIPFTTGNPALFFAQI